MVPRLPMRICSSSDDASPDGTGELADSIAARSESARFAPSGKARSWNGLRRAFTKGLEEGYDYFFEMDADGSHDPRYLADFFRELRAGADVVVGSRNIPGGGVEGWGLGRHVLSKGGSLYSRVILGVPVRDLTTGYKAFTRRALETIGLSDIRSNG